MMKPGARGLVWLGGMAGAGAIVFAVYHWRADGAAAPPQAPASTPAPPMVSVPQADPAPPAAVAPASTPVVAMAAMPASAVLRVQPGDVSRLQRDVQLAIGSDQRGKAGEAARHIQRCLALERDPERSRQSMEGLLRRLPESAHSTMRAGHQQLVASCQAVDESSRAQLVPLLRRSLAEGDKGAAAGLVRALGKDFNLADDPGVLPALRRDAWDCDDGSQRALSNLARRDPQLLPPNEIGALRDLERIQFSKSLETLLRQAEGDSKRQAVLKSMLATYKPPPEADPAEVARISAEIQSRCEAARASLLGGNRTGAP